MGRTYDRDHTEAGFHPSGFRIDRSADAMGMYTRYRVTPTGEWADPEPVRFDDLPRDGWLRSDPAKRREDGLKDGFVVAVASGKGGTGKTTVATNLALAAAEAGHDVSILDCDVEAPNVHLFLKPKIDRRVEVAIPVPEVDEQKCDACGECGRICEFSAIVSLGTKPLVFPELCHGCGGCTLVCPKGAITEMRHVIGVFEEGASQGVDFLGGRLNIGQPMAPPLIRAVKEGATPEGIVIIDAPPGASCPAVEAVRNADFVLLVAEPTPFGLNDLSIAVETVRKLGIPLAVVVNRAAPGRCQVNDYCGEDGIDILAELPDDRRVAEAYSRGETAMQKLAEFRAIFVALLESVLARAAVQ